MHYSIKVPWVVAIRSSGERLREESRKGDVGHTHNMYLQLLLDVGLIGVLLAVAFFYAGVQRRNRLMNLVRMTSEPNAVLNRACLNADLYVHSLVFLLFSGLFTGHTVFGIPCTLVLFASMGAWLPYPGPLRKPKLERTRMLK